MCLLFPVLLIVIIYTFIMLSCSGQVYSHQICMPSDTKSCIVTHRRALTWWLLLAGSFRLHCSSGLYETNIQTPADCWYWVYHKSSGSVWFEVCGLPRWFLLTAATNQMVYLFTTYGHSHACPTYHFISQDTYHFSLFVPSRCVELKVGVAHVHIVSESFLCL